MENQVTSIEQSKRLIDLGVPAEKASMVWATCSGKYHLSVLPHYKATPEYIKSGESIPAFTVADLLGVMPPDIPAVVGQNHDYALTLSNNFCGTCATKTATRTSALESNSNSILSTSFATVLSG